MDLVHIKLRHLGTFHAVTSDPQEHMAVFAFICFALSEFLFMITRNIMVKVIL